MDQEILRNKHIIEEIIKEHNDIWKDISIDFKNYKAPKGYRCFNLKEEDIITLASGLVRKGVK